MKVLVLSGLMLLLSASPAQAGYGFRLTGYHANPLMRSWAHESKMPLPKERVWVGYGNPMMEPGTHTIYLPSCCSQGWTHSAVEGLLYHELGHVFDHTNMNPTYRAEFRQLAGVPLGWNWWKPMRTVDWRVNDHYFVKIAPGEMFAEEYAACSLGETQYQYQTDPRGFNSYGWYPPQETDESKLCGLIQQAALHS